jgi:hypothetical protein
MFVYLPKVLDNSQQASIKSPKHVCDIQSAAAEKHQG